MPDVATKPHSFPRTKR